MKATSIKGNPQDEMLILRSLKKVSLLNKIDVVRDVQKSLDYLFAQGEFSARTGEELPTMVLLAISLPRMSGLKVLERLRTSRINHLLPVVLLTSSYEDKYRLRGYLSGANSYVRKPLDFSEFDETVARLGVHWVAINEAPPQYQS